jgi:glycosyltransferase involved in cell wall biosynthesis
MEDKHMNKNYNILLTLMGLEIGGAETHVVELAKGLKKEGFNIITASNGGVYEQELINNGIKHYKVPLHNKKPHNILKSYFLLEKIIQDEKIDLVHAHARIPAFICGRLHKKMKFPFITTAHWVFNTKWGLKYITNWGQKTIAVSEDIKKYLIQNYNICEDNITVTINGIDTEKFSPNTDSSDVKREFNLNDDCTRIVYISRLDEDRSEIAFHLVEVVPELVEKIKDLEVVIVGDGDVFGKIQKKSEEVNHKLGRRVIVLTGGRTDINKFVALADLFIGVSRAALEAMAAERPVIVAGNEGYIGIFDHDKLATAINSNFTCRGERKGEPNRLKEDILEVLTKMDDDKRRELGRLGKQVIEERYSVGRMVKDNMDVYMQMLSNNKK